MERDDGGPAFPGELLSDAGNRFPTNGMSLRDYLAGQAIQGCAAAIYTDRLLQKMAGDKDLVARAVAEAGYLIADALLEKRAEADES